MRNRKINFIKLGIFLFGVSLLLTNCQKDEIIGHSNTEAPENPPFKISKINSITIKENPKILKSIESLKKEKIKSKNLLGKQVYSNEYDFTIETDYATYIENEDNSYHSYTFPIQRTVENGLLENLLLSLQSNGNYKTFIVSYNITKQEQENLNNSIEVNLENKVDFTEINGEKLISNIFAKETTCGINLNFECWSTPCEIDGCWDPQYTGTECGTVISYGSCSTGGGGNNTGDGSNNSGNGTGTGTGTNHGDGTTTTSNPDITSPFICGDDCVEFIDPCDELNDIINSNKANVKPFLENLKTTVDQSGENGFSMKKDGNTYTTSDLAPTTGNSIGIPTGGTNYAGAHSHPSIGVYPMYSWDDIYTLLNLYQRAQSDIRNEVTFILTSKNYFLNSQVNVFALKINDFRAFRRAFYKALADIVAERNDLETTDSIEDKLDALNEKLGRKYRRAGENQQEKAFLENFKGFELSLYKTDDNINNWSEVKTSQLTPTASGVIEIPCN